MNESLVISKQNNGREAAASVMKGCQIFLGKTYQNGKKICQMITKCTEWTLKNRFGHEIDKLAINNTNIFYCKTFQNLPKLGFLV
jgi:hypothetical protein